MMSNSIFAYSERIKSALASLRPIVALESTVISHGLPYPDNLQTALDCERTIIAEGAEPATVGIVSGVPTIGLTADELKAFAENSDGIIEKVSLGNMAAVVSKRGCGASTVAATIRIASLGGIPYDSTPRPLVFATGGIGGVHRGDSLDISADLHALASTQIICVCAGAKAILDLPKTREYLETLGVPVIGFQTEEFPSFYCRRSGLKVDASVETADEAAELSLAHWRLGSPTAVLICVPIPAEYEIPAPELNALIEDVQEHAIESGVQGREITPFLLSRIAALTKGRAVAANKKLLISNARIAAQIAVSLKSR